MEKDRIQINGVWYVREDTIDNEYNIVCFEGMTTENNEYCFEATRIMRDDGETFFPGVDVKFTNKTSGETEYWDNDEWLIGVLEDNSNSIRLALESLNDEGLRLFKQLLNKAKEKGWL